jgi:hypothetical protein
LTVYLDCFSRLFISVVLLVDSSLHLYLDFFISFVHLVFFISSSSSRLLHLVFFISSSSSPLLHLLSFIFSPSSPLLQLLSSNSSPSPRQHNFNYYLAFFLFFFF